MSKLEIMGRVIGTFEDEDMIDDLKYIYYGFVPLPEVEGLPSGDVTIYYGAGTISTYEGDEIKDCVDLIPIIAGLPIAPRHADHEGDKELDEVEEPNEVEERKLDQAP